MLQTPTLTSKEIKQFAQKIQAQMREKQDKLNSFAASALYHRMVCDIVERNISLTSEGFAYYPEKVKNSLGWEDISSEDIETFIDAVSDPSVGVDEPVEGYVDPECSFGNFTFYKENLKVFVMWGQGTIVIISPIK